MTAPDARLRIAVDIIRTAEAGTLPRAALRDRLSDPLERIAWERRFTLDEHAHLALLALKECAVKIARGRERGEWHQFGVTPSDRSQSGPAVRR